MSAPIAKGRPRKHVRLVCAQVNAKRPRLGASLVVLHVRSSRIRLALQVVFKELVSELEVCLPAVHPERYVSSHSIRGFRGAIRTHQVLS
jgi:hypothetical protein